MGLPLIFELCFTGTLLTLLNQAERESRQALHAREVIAQDLILQQLMVDCSSSIGQYLFLDSEETKRKYQATLLRVPIEFQKLSLLLADDPKRLKQSKKVEKITQDMIRMQGVAIDSWKNGNHTAAFILMTKFKVKWDLLMELMDRLVEIDRSADLSKRRAEENIRQLVKVAIAFGVLGNIALSIFLAISFDRSTTQRLRILMNNINALSERKPLAPAVGGNDEVGELDAVFHKMVQDLRQLERTKEEFVAMVSHDLRTPLTSIMLTAEQWAEGVYGKPSEKGLITAQRTCANAKRLINLVNTLLDLEKMENEKLRLSLSEIAAGTILEQAGESVRAIAEQNNLKLDIQPCDTLLLVDAERIIEVLVNFLSNAIKFSPQGTTITISAKAQGNEDVLFSVSDQGRGISAADCQKIFNRFYQIQADDGKQKRGFGLGLAICKKIIEEHGGKIGVTSEEGKGSSFWFTIPQ